MTVWVVHPVKDDLSAASPFGKIKYVTKGYVYPDEMPVMTDALRTLPENIRIAIRAAANEFDPAVDHLLLAGDHLQLVYFVTQLSIVLSLVGFRVLRYDREAKGYIDVHIQPA